MRLLMMHRTGLEQRNVQAKCQGSETGLCVQDNEDSHLLSRGRSVSLGGGACAFPEGHFYLVVGRELVGCDWPIFSPHGPTCASKRNTVTVSMTPRCASVSCFFSPRFPFMLPHK